MPKLSRLFALSLLSLSLAACGQQTESPSATADPVKALRLAPVCSPSDDPDAPLPVNDPDCPPPLPLHHIQTLDELGRLNPKEAYIAYVMRGGMGILGDEKGKYLPTEQALHDSGLPDADVFAQSKPYSFINWTSNGCSSPKLVKVVTLGVWDRVFNRA